MVVADAGAAAAAAAAGIEVVAAVRVPAADSKEVEGTAAGMVARSEDEMVVVLAREGETVAVVAVETVVEAEAAAWLVELVELVLETGKAESASSWADVGYV